MHQIHDDWRSGFRVFEEFRHVKADNGVCFHVQGVFCVVQRPTQGAKAVTPARQAHVNAVLLSGVQELHDGAQAPLCLWNRWVHDPRNCLCNFRFLARRDGHAFAPHQVAHEVFQEGDVVGGGVELERVEAG